MRETINCKKQSKTIKYALLPPVKAKKYKKSRQYRFFRLRAR